jgi:hypothetical protein
MFSRFSGRAPMHVVRSASDKMQYVASTSAQQLETHYSPEPRSRHTPALLPYRLYITAIVDVRRYLSSVSGPRHDSITHGSMAITF